MARTSPPAATKGPWVSDDITRDKRRRVVGSVMLAATAKAAKSAVLNSLSSASGQRTYDHAIGEFVRWYCSEPRLAFNRTVVLRYRIYLEQRAYLMKSFTSRMRRVSRQACRLRSAKARP